MGEIRIREISAVMADALATAFDHGGRLERRPGGFWTWPGCPLKNEMICGYPVPEWHVTTGTIQGLVTRRLMGVTDRLPRAVPCTVRLFAFDEQQEILNTATDPAPVPVTCGRSADALTADRPNNSENLLRIKSAPQIAALSVGS